MRYCWACMGLERVMVWPDGRSHSVPCFVCYGRPRADDGDFHPVDYEAAEISEFTRVGLEVEAEALRQMGMTAREAADRLMAFCAYDFRPPPEEPRGEPLAEPNPNLPTYRPR